MAKYRCRRGAGRPTVLVRISSADRVIYEATDKTPEVTKLMVAEYVVSVADGLMRALRDRPTALERWPSSASARASELATGPWDKDRRGVLPEAGAEGRSRRPRVGGDHLPVRQDRRRDLPYRDRGAGRVRGRRADLPSLACTTHPMSTTPTSSGSTSTRSPARPSPMPSASPASLARCSRSSASAGYPKTSGNRGDPHLRPDRATVDVRGRAARGDRVRARARAARHGRDHRLVEGGARRADLRRLQPEQPRPDDRVGLLAAPDPRRPGLDPDVVGRDRRGDRPP